MSLLDDLVFVVVNEARRVVLAIATVTRGYGFMFWSSRRDSLCTYDADDHARISLTHRTPYTDSAHDRARRLMPHRTPCTETAHDRADKRCTPCTSSDSSPVLARPLCRRGSLPLRALRRQLIPILVNIGTVDIRNRYPHLRTPHRRHSSHAPHGVERPLAKKLGTRLSNRGSKYFI